MYASCEQAGLTDGFVDCLSFRYTNKEVQGTKFMDMLCFIVDNINSPEMIHAKIGELGGMHYRLGVRAAHMVTSTKPYTLLNARAY